MKNISVLGSTGSIGRQTLEVVRQNKQNLKIVALATHTGWNELLQQIQEFHPEIVCVFDEIAAAKLTDAMNCIEGINKPKLVVGMEGLIQSAIWDSVDIVVTAVVGMVGLRPTLEAIKNKKIIALANKETLVTGGHLVMELAKQYDVPIFPVDSEHSAIFQCLQGEESSKIKKLILTASGGPFRGRSMKDLEDITPNEALRHPTWTMGRKISIDSATLMNKGLEVIEATYLFNVAADAIKVVIHPQSIIHSMVEFIDGSIIAQMGSANMTLPIQYALMYPHRTKGIGESLDFFENDNLTFEKPDTVTFPCLKMAYDCLKEPKSSLVVLNGANEALVNEFLKGKITFMEISKKISIALKHHDSVDNPSLEEILMLDQWAREFVVR